MTDAPEHGWLIHKAGRGWYRPDAKGYTMNQDEAGRYSHKDALAYNHPNGLDGPRDGLTIKHESELPPSPADLHQQALDAAREEGRRAGLKEGFAMAVKALRDQVPTITNAQTDWGTGWNEAIEHVVDIVDSIFPKPADPVAEAARKQKDHARTMKEALFGLIGSAQEPVENPAREDLTYGGVLVDSPDGPKIAYLRLTFEHIAQKEGE